MEGVPMAPVNWVPVLLVQEVSTSWEVVAGVPTGTCP